MPLSCSVSRFFCLWYYRNFNLQPASYEYHLFFYITKLATKKNCRPTLSDNTNNFQFKFTGTVDLNDATQTRQCSGFGMAGLEEDSVSKLVNPRNSLSSHLCTATAIESNVARWRQVSRGIEYMTIFLKTGGNFKSNTGHFYINFEYKTHLNFGGNFSKKKVRLIVRKIRQAYVPCEIRKRPAGAGYGCGGCWTTDIGDRVYRDVPSRYHGCIEVAGRHFEPFL